MTPSPDILLYHTPGSCSRVTINALEEIGLTYAERPIDIFKGEQRGVDYQAVSPKMKVPALLVDGELLTETPAILWWLSTTYPAASLLPGGDPPDLLGLADLSWCSNTLHPLARAVRMPARLTSGDPAPVQEVAMAQLAPLLALVEEKVANSPWWYGEAWSIVDVYLSWITGMASTMITPETFPAILRHVERVRSRPSFARALTREQAALDRAGIELPGGGRL